VQLHKGYRRIQQAGGHRNGGGYRRIKEATGSPFGEVAGYDSGHDRGGWLCLTTLFWTSMVGGESINDKAAAAFNQQGSSTTGVICGSNMARNVFV